MRNSIVKDVFKLIKFCVALGRGDLSAKSTILLERPDAGLIVCSRIVMVASGMNKKPNFDGMSVDELWQLHEELSQVLSVRLTSEKRELEKRLSQLRREKEMRQIGIRGAREARRASAGSTRAYSQNIEIPRSLPKPGRVAGSSLAGSRPL